jgi:glycerophosphoryl diester phosphodiesterase
MCSLGELESSSSTGVPLHVKLVLEWDMPAKSQVINDDTDQIEEHASVKQVKTTFLKVWDWVQGCQIFLDTIYQQGGKIYQMTTKYTEWPKNISNGRKIVQMSIKYSNIYPCKALQNFSNLLFLVRKYIIWQP